MFEAVFCKRARVGLFFLDKQWTNKIAIYNDCKPLFSDSYKLCVDNFSVRIVVYDGLVARLDTWKIQCKMPPKTKKILPPENIQ